MKNNSKFIERLLILIVIIVFISLGFITYQRYKNNNDDEQIINNYYNLEFLFNNGYVRPANTIDSFNNDEVSFTLNDNTLVIESEDTEKVISGLPNNNLKIYYNYLKDDCYEFAGLDSNHLYYANFCISDKDSSSFERISTNVKEIYVPSAFKDSVYVTSNNIISNFIIVNTLNEIKYISYKEGVLGIYDNLEEVMPYFDYVCASDNLSICNDIMVYSTFDKHLVFNYNLDDVIKNDIGEDLIVQDFFGVFETNVNIKDLENMNFNEFNKKYEYLFTVYVLDKNNNLYTIQMNNNAISNKALVNAISVSSETVRNIEYKKDDNNVTSVVINFVNGEPIEIVESDTLDIITSTLYDRK